MASLLAEGVKAALPQELQDAASKRSLLSGGSLDAFPPHVREALLARPLRCLLRTRRSRGHSPRRAGELRLPPRPPLPDSLRRAPMLLQSGRQPEPEDFENTTIFFSDIVTFTELSSALSPKKVSDMLQRLYRQFDELCTKHGLYKARP